MNTLVSFELAKLLKEKGFYKPLPSICFIKEEYNYTSTMVYEVLDMNFEYILRPTIAEVVMWLYENHGIWISVECDVYGKLWYAKSTVASKNLWENEDKRHEILTSFRKFPNEHDTPTKAYEAAIEYTLNNSIWHKKK